MKITLCCWICNGAFRGNPTKNTRKWTTYTALLECAKINQKFKLQKKTNTRQIVVNTVTGNLKKTKNQKIKFE